MRILRDLPFRTDLTRRIAAAVLGSALACSNASDAQDRPSGYPGMQFREMRTEGGSPSFRTMGPPGGMMGPPGGFDRGSFDRGSFDRGSFDRSRYDRETSDRDKDRDRDRSRDERRDYGSSSSSKSYGGSSRDGSSSNSSSSSAAPERVRVTMELQSAFVAADTDADGQIGLYEWKQGRRSLSSFMQIDANHDGFLTPRELEQAGSIATVAVSTPAVPGAVPTTSTVASTPTSSTPAPAVAASPATPAPAPFVSKLSDKEQEESDAAQARNFVNILDKDKDGKLSASELANSRTIRPLFEKAGFSFSDPMPADQFVANYVQIQKGRRS